MDSIWEVHAALKCFFLALPAAILLAKSSSTHPGGHAHEKPGARTTKLPLFWINLVALLSYLPTLAVLPLGWHAPHVPRWAGGYLLVWPLLAIPFTFTGFVLGLRAVPTVRNTLLLIVATLLLILASSSILVLNDF